MSRTHGTEAARAALHSTPAAQLRRTVGRQVVGLEGLLQGLRASLDEARRDNRALVEDGARLRDALVRAEAARLALLDDRARSSGIALEQRELAQRNRALEQERTMLGDRCADLSLALEQERRISRRLRQDVDALMAEVERLCAILGVLLEEGGAPP